MKATFDEILAAGIKSRATPDRIICDLLEAELAERWKEEDIDKMHTYREAIQGVTGSFILYPGAQAIFYPCHAGSSFIEGVGALALRPRCLAEGNTFYDNNLRRVIETFLLSE